MTGSGVPVRKHPTLLQVFLQSGGEGLGVGPFKKEGKGLKPQRGDFPSWTPEGARALRGLKDRAWAGYGGAGGPRRAQGPRKSVSGSEAAAVTSLYHRLRLLGGWGGGGRGRSEDGGARGSGHAGVWGAERKERGEAVKGPEAGAVASPVPAGPAPTSAPHTPPGPAGLLGLQTCGGQASPSSSSSAASSSGKGAGRAEKAGQEPRGAAGRAQRAREGRRQPEGGRGGAAGDPGVLSPPACVSPGHRGPPTPHSPSGCSLRAGVGEKGREAGLRV